MACTAHGEENCNECANAFDARRRKLLADIAPYVDDDRRPLVLVLGASKDLRYPLWMTRARGTYVFVALDENPSASQVAETIAYYVEQAPRTDLKSVEVKDAGSRTYGPQPLAIVNEFAKWHEHLAKDGVLRRQQCYRVRSSIGTLELELYELDYDYFFAKVPRGTHANFTVLIDKASWMDTTTVLPRYLRCLASDGVWITDRSFVFPRLDHGHAVITALGLSHTTKPCQSGYGYDPEAAHIYRKSKTHGLDHLTIVFRFFEALKPGADIVAKRQRVQELVADDVREKIAEARVLLGGLRSIDPLLQNVRVLRLLLEEVELGFEGLILRAVSTVTSGPRTMTGVALLHAYRPAENAGMPQGEWMSRVREGLALDSKLVRPSDGAKFQITKVTPPAVVKSEMDSEDDVPAPSPMLTSYELTPL